MALTISSRKYLCIIDTKIGASVLHEHVIFDKGVRIHQKLDPFSRCQLSLNKRKNSGQLLELSFEGLRLQSQLLPLLQN